MAYAVLLSLSQTIDQFTDHDEYPISVNGKQKIASLFDHIIYLQQFIQEFPDQANSLEARINYAANEAEDIIEHFMYEQIRSGTNVEYDFRDLEIVIDEINSISREVRSKISMVGVTPTTVSNLAAVVGGPAVGLDDDLAKVRSFLCGGSHDRQILAITGMGGIGKTTLARNAYHDPLIEKCFDIRAWVTVSQDYNTEDFLASLLDSLEREEGEVYGNGRLSKADKLHRIFEMRKCLIVLDDVWSEKACDDINMVVPMNLNNGIRIVITTRLENLACKSFSLHLMNSTQSWKLLNQNIFRSKECPPALETIGKDIAKKCGGLSLAIVLAAGILSAVEETQSAWEEVARNLRRDIQRIEYFKKTMYLSYTYLPHRLRACFLYMAGFPEDYEIRVSKLIKIWIAEGFVRATTSRSLEEEGEEYVKNLVQTSLALVKSFKANGRIKSVSVHDLVRELYKRKAEEENFERRLSVAHPDLTCLARAYASTLRSVIIFQPNESSLSGLRLFRLLRLLDVVDTDVYSLPPQVFELFHLRYLAFGCPMEIPAAISRLRNLRTLIIRPSKRFMIINSNDEVYLPLEIWSLPLLTDLVSFFDLLPNPEGTDSAMEKLVTLTLEKKLICSEEMMRRIPNLKKLRVAYFGNKYKEDYQLQNLARLQKLEKLTLVIKDNPTDQVMVKPVFPAKLQKLTLSGWRLSWDDMEAVGALTNLQVLKLKDHACEGDTWTTKKGQFLALEFLLIDTSELENWETKRFHFPKLKLLELYRCYSLEEIPESIGNILTLEMIKVHHASRSLVECVHGIQTEQQDEYGHQIQLDCAHYDF